MSKGKTLFFCSLLVAALVLVIVSTVSASFIQPGVEFDEALANTSLDHPPSHYDTADVQLTEIKEESNRSTSLKTDVLEAEEPLIEDIQHLDSERSINVDELSDELTTDNHRSTNVLTISQQVAKDTLTIFHKEFEGQAGSHLAWHIVWDGVAEAKIGVVGEDGQFYYLSNTEGSSMRKISIPLTQTYRFAIKHSDHSATFSGWRGL